jgi:hypothetical protein
MWNVFAISMGFAGIFVVGKRVRGNKGDVGVGELEGELIIEGGSDSVVRLGRSEWEKRGESNSERLLCLCLSAGCSVKKGSSPRFGL